MKRRQGQEVKVACMKAAKSVQAAEHMKIRWKLDINQTEERTVRIVTDESTPWFICTMVACLPGDRDGESTGLAIVEQHNAGLKGKAARKG